VTAIRPARLAGISLDCPDPLRHDLRSVRRDGASTSARCRIRFRASTGCVDRRSWARCNTGCPFPRAAAGPEP